MSMEQTIVYRVNLPQFILNFKNHVVKMILPPLIQLKQVVNNQENSEVLNPLVVIFAVLIVLIVLKNIWNLLFGKRETKGQANESPELNNEINDLKKQLKSLKTSFFELTKELNAKQNPQATLIKKTQTNMETFPDKQSFNDLLELYSASLQQNKSLIDYVLESQCEVLKQLKKFKKLNKNSSLSNGKPSISTIRSKTTQKKLESKDKSSSKVEKILMKTEMKMSIPKTLQKQSKPQLLTNKKVEESVQESLENEIKQQQKPQINMHLRIPQKSKNLPAPIKHSNKKVETKISVKEEKIEVQQTLIPTTNIPQGQSSLPEAEIQIEVQKTTITESQSIEVVSTMNGIQTTNIQETTFSAETNITTQFEQLQQNVTLTVSVPQVEEIIVINPQKPPQLKKSTIPPGTRSTIKRPPPPPRK